MPIANIQILKGRSEADRKRLIAQVTQAIIDSLGVEAGQVRVVISEIDPCNWGVGGIAKSDLMR
ncbi:2-hydroxymuconate tautomerase family protein [Novosphingobium humi]|uniref:Tautomerase n=1 Tax=Novosphingobium humi TaxID=2282397 RepID=A0ABY7U1N8_9SPHN|nr:2-hydroxymuconate tautomerase family protein [Novosphingobium humi]WCT79148.1 2-hydroxymuconate tautomerase family protein [Novosphingobium humi]